MNIAEKLRPKRKELVLAAKEVMEASFAGGKAGVNKAQLSHLIAVCNEAACVEEIELYIRYQASRDKADGDGRRKNKGGVWDDNVAENVIKHAQTITSKLDTDEIKVAAWRLYAVYLTREFTYQKAVHSGGDGAAANHGGAAEGDKGGGQQHGHAFGGGGARTEGRRNFDARGKGGHRS